MNLLTASAISDLNDTTPMIIFFKPHIVELFVHNRISC